MYSRHDLVWLTPAGWRAAAGRAGPRERAALELWEREDWPAVVRRHDAGAGQGCVSLGIALPPHPVDGTKARIGLHARYEHVARHIAPIPLAQARASAPERWHAGLDELLAQPGARDLRAYGSLALQALTGQNYLSSTSDIDVLFLPLTNAQLQAGVDTLANCAGRLPLDGEIVFPTGEAVAWKEWRDARDGARVLAKSIGAVRLADPASLLATLEAR
jgi:phosphoribosyl-dephospho-CoA transferase